MTTTRKCILGGMAVLGLMGGSAFAAPERKQRSYLDVTWWDPYVTNITDVDTYLRRKFRQDVTDRATGLATNRWAAVANAWRQSELLRLLWH